MKILYPFHDCQYSLAHAFPKTKIILNGPFENFKNKPPGLIRQIIGFKINKHLVELAMLTWYYYFINSISSDCESNYICR